MSIKIDEVLNFSTQRRIRRYLDAQTPEVVFKTAEIAEAVLAAPRTVRDAVRVSSDYAIQLPDRSWAYGTPSAIRRLREVLKDGR